MVEQAWQPLYVFENKQPESSEAKAKTMLPEHGKSMAKAKDLAGKVQDQSMVTTRRTARPMLGCLLCCPVSSLPSWHSQSLRRSAAQRTALSMLGGTRRKRKGHAGALRGLLSAY
jgi:hypothetical protein